MAKKELSSVRFTRENRQLLFGIILVVVIPGLVVLNSLIFFKNLELALDQELHERSVTVGQITSNFIADSLNDPVTLQSKIETIIFNSPELSFLEIDRLEEIELVVWASTEKDRIGMTDRDPTAFFALQQNRAVSARGSSPDGSENYWKVSYPLKDITGESAILKMNLSTERVAFTLRRVLWQSTLMLIGVLFVIILLLLVNSRLFQYAVLYKKLQQLDQAKDDFISIASHELRTPITAIQGYFSMLADGSYGKISKKTKESVEFMSENVHRLQSLVEDLLNVSRIQQGRMKLEKTDFDGKLTIEEVVKSLIPSATEKKLELITAIQESVMIHADQDRFKQVLINIIGNAVKYTKKGSVTISLSVEKNMASIKVKDTGIGMSATEQERLFEKFYRAQNEQTQKIVGTGLGLWITKAIVELMGGKIFVDSIENTGTQVTFTMPLAKGNEKNVQKK